MQSGIQFEKIPARAPRKSGDALNVTYRRVQQKQDRRISRRIANILKGRA